MSLLRVEGISKSFSGTTVLRSVSFQADEGEIVCLLGPSGCGKTTLLRVIAGLEVPDAGRVVFAGQVLEEVPVHRRGFGLMFQDYALFPHKAVADNVAFGLRMQGLSKNELRSRVTEMLDLVGLAGYERRRTHDLSGGEQQRVALARSLAPGPRLLMLDEPLGSLDRALREGLMNELRTILRRVGVTVVYVTHDQQEAFAVADNLVIMNQGAVVQRGTPQTAYHRPASAWVARFLGLTNLVPGRIAAVCPESGSEAAAVIQVETPLGLIAVRTGERHGQPQLDVDERVTVLIRPEAARFAETCPGEPHLPLSGVVRRYSFRGAHHRIVVSHQSGQELAFELVTDVGKAPQVGDAVNLVLCADGVSLLLENPYEPSARN